MGRGRAKAKQAKVARQLKYNIPNMDLDSLQRELAGKSEGNNSSYADDHEAKGILESTTQRRVFDYAEKHGWKVKQRPMELEHILGADSVWLVSSSRGPVLVTAVDEHPTSTHKAANKQARALLNAALGF